MATFSTVAAMTITTASIADGNGRIATGVDNSTDEYQKIHLYCRLETGTTPTADSRVNFYFYREDDHATEYVSDGQTLTDGSLSVTPSPPTQFIGAMISDGTSDTRLYLDTVVHDPGPGRWSVGFMNETGATLSTTEADGFIHWVGEKA